MELKWLIFMFFGLCGAIGVSAFTYLLYLLFRVKYKWHAYLMQKYFNRDISKGYYAKAALNTRTGFPIFLVIALGAFAIGFLKQCIQ